MSDPSKKSYFASQEKIYPKRVWGRFRKLKWVAMIVTLGIYYLAPFLRWDRGPNAPDQAILIDLPNRKAYWFWIEIWPQEVYILTGILILSAIALFFITSLFGRVWCGYFCPQTVWTDLFVWVERIIQGDRNARKKLHESKLSWEKVRKITMTHFLWLVIAWCTAGSFVLYFNDAPTLVRDFLQLNVSTTVLAFIGGLTFSTYLMAGFAREQVCTYMCPYARFQSAMFDEDTLIIGYDEKRGEPRGKHKKGESWDGRGHCINCTACVQVCPMGIDIRDGLQMECIACGLCIDACDDIMDKIDLPRGLIRYDTARYLECEKGDESKKFKLIRPRTIYYTIVLSAVACVMLYALIARKPHEVNILRDRSPVFVKLSNGDIRNGYTLKILNKTNYPQTFTMAVEGIDGANLKVTSAKNLDTKEITAEPNAVESYHAFVTVEKDHAKNSDITFTLKNKETGVIDTHVSKFIARKK